MTPPTNEKGKLQDVDETVVIGNTIDRLDDMMRYVSDESATEVERFRSDFEDAAAITDQAERKPVLSSLLSHMATELSPAKVGIQTTMVFSRPLIIGRVGLGAGRGLSSCFYSSQFGSSSFAGVLVDSTPL